MLTIKQQTVSFNLPEIDQVTISVKCLEEHSPIRGNVIISDSPTLDKQVEDQIIADYEGGNDWAWCTVQVTAEWKGITGTDYLGQCSYNSEEDYKKNSGYYEDMKFTAYNELITNLKALGDDTI